MPLNKVLQTVHNAKLKSFKTKNKLLNTGAVSVNLQTSNLEILEI